MRTCNKCPYNKTCNGVYNKLFHDVDGECIYDEIPVYEITMRHIGKKLTIVPSTLRTVICVGIVITVGWFSIPYVVRFIIWSAELLKSIF